MGGSRFFLSLFRFGLVVPDPSLGPSLGERLAALGDVVVYGVLLAVIGGFFVPGAQREHGVGVLLLPDSGFHCTD